MPKYDRLSALIERFSLHIHLCDLSEANIVITANPDTQKACTLYFSPLTTGFICSQNISSPVLLSASMAMGGQQNPLCIALPPQINLPIKPDSDIGHIVNLLHLEAQAQRCGARTVLNRLAEILMIRVLRMLLERGTTTPGLLGGLADDRLGRAIVAIHEYPGHNWQNQDLASIAGLSLSRFSELFGQIVGTTPMSYLRHWRMTLARQDLEKGDRVQQIAYRYGYKSSEALSRSFQRHFGVPPLTYRPN